MNLRFGHVVFRTLPLDTFADGLNIIDSESVGCPERGAHISDLDPLFVKLIKGRVEQIDPHAQVLVGRDFYGIFGADPKPTCNGLIGVMARLRTYPYNALSCEPLLHRTGNDTLESDLRAVQIRDRPSDGEHPPRIIGVVIDQVGQGGDGFDFELIRALAVTVGA